MTTKELLYLMGGILLGYVFAMLYEIWCERRHTARIRAVRKAMGLRSSAPKQDNEDMRRFP